MAELDIMVLAAPSEKWILEDKVVVVLFDLVKVVHIKLDK